MKKDVQIAVIDAETDPFAIGRTDIKPFIWGFYDGSQYQQFDDTSDLVEFLEDYDGIVYAHNGGKFDFHFMSAYFPEYAEIMVINGRIAKIQLGACELRDSWLILPMPLAAYKKDDFDYTLMERGTRDIFANRQKIETYLKADCVYLFELVSRFVMEYGPNLTLAGTAMKVWKELSPVPVPETDVDFYDAFAPYYYGGRVQCFEQGIIDSTFNVYDINSAYPFAMMQQHPYSSNFSRVAGYVPKADFYRLTCISRGAFPYRTIDGGLSFPNVDEIREYTITGWEYSAAIETKTILDCTILESTTFCGHVEFSSYINKFFDLRMEATAKGDDGGRLIYKLLMNSLYGKFAANPGNYKNYTIVTSEEAEEFISAGWEFGGMLGEWTLLQADLEPDQEHYYNVATGASITGYVRAMLWRAIHNSDRVIYCDTDSIAVVGEAAVDCGKALGQWKDEGEYIRAGIAGKKLYAFESASGEHKTASKGVKLGFEEIMKVAKGGTVVYHPPAPTFSVRKPPTQTSRRVVMTAK